MRACVCSANIQLQILLHATHALFAYTNTHTHSNSHPVAVVVVAECDTASARAMQSIAQTKQNHFCVCTMPTRTSCPAFARAVC